MPEIRIDPLTGLRAVVATGGEVPEFHVAPVDPIDPAEDPLAGGHEQVFASPEPVLTTAATEPQALDNPDLFSAIAARGGHEIIVNGPQPVRSLAELPAEQAVAAVELWRDRMRAHDVAAYVHVSVDERRAGAPQHTHAELHALEFVPAVVARERERFGAYATRTMGGNLLEDLVQEEVRRRERIVAIDAEAVLWCPYASQHPFQLMLAPRRGRPRFEDEGATGAALLHEGLSLLRARFGGVSPPLSLWVRTAPRGTERFCWRIDVVPRLIAPGALDLGTGVAYNPVAPEHAAAELRALRR